MREQTSTLMGAMRKELGGGDDVSPEEALRRAWIAYRLGNMEKEVFGARSFVWVTLGCIFDAIKEIEDVNRAITR